MSESMRPEELKIHEDETVVVEEGYDVVPSEGDNGIKVAVSVEKT